jgi:hypothetical protein
MVFAGKKNPALKGNQIPFPQQSKDSKTDPHKKGWLPKQPPFNLIHVVSYGVTTLQPNCSLSARAVKPAVTYSTPSISCSVASPSGRIPPRMKPRAVF